MLYLFDMGGVVLHGVFEMLDIMKAAEDLGIRALLFRDLPTLRLELDGEHQAS